MKLKIIFILKEGKLLATKPYKTKQKELITQALQTFPNQHATAEDLLDYLKSNGKDIGFTTIYRNLDKLVNDGHVLKYTLPDGSKACYQYLTQCDDEHIHSHVICTGCGKISHLECGAVDTLASHLLKEHSIILDTQKTVFYGLCKDCSNK